MLNMLKNLMSKRRKVITAGVIVFATMILGDLLNINSICMTVFNFTKNVVVKSFTTVCNFSNFVLSIIANSFFIRLFVIACLIILCLKLYNIFSAKFKINSENVNNKLDRVLNYFCIGTVGKKVCKFIISILVIMSISSAVIGLNNLLSRKANVIQEPQQQEQQESPKENEEQQEEKSEENAAEDKQEETVDEKEEEPEQKQEESEEKKVETKAIPKAAVRSEGKQESSNINYAAASPEVPKKDNTVAEGNTQQQDETPTTDDSQADSDVIKDEKEEEVQSAPENNDVEVTEPQLEEQDVEKPQEESQTPQEDENVENEEPQGDGIPDFDDSNSDFAQPVVSISGPERVKINDNFVITVTATDDVNLKNFYLAEGHVVYDGQIEILEIKTDGNTATINCKAKDVGTVHIAVASNVAEDAAGNTSGVSNTLTILVEENSDGNEDVQSPDLPNEEENLPNPESPNNPQEKPEDNPNLDTDDPQEQVPENPEVGQQPETPDEPEKPNTPDEPENPETSDKPEAEQQPNESEPQPQPENSEPEQPEVEERPNGSETQPQPEVPDEPQIQQPENQNNQPEPDQGNPNDVEIPAEPDTTPAEPTIPEGGEVADDPVEFEK